MGQGEGNGSEHAVGGRHFAGELHLVHAKGHLSLAEALEEPDGLAVLAVFLRLSNVDADALAPLYSCQRGDVDWAVRGLILTSKPD